MRGFGTGGPLEEASEDHRSAASAMEVDNVDKNGMCGEGITDEDCYMHRQRVNFLVCLSIAVSFGQGEEPT